MFAPLYPEVSKRRGGLLSASLILHFVFLGWLLHSPAPIFVAQLSVVKGQSGSMVTRIYFGGDSGVAQEKPKPRVSWQRPQKKKCRAGFAAACSQVGDGKRNRVGSSQWAGGRVALRIAFLWDDEWAGNSSCAAGCVSRSRVWIGRGGPAGRCDCRDHHRRSGEHCAENRAAKPWPAIDGRVLARLRNGSLARRRRMGFRFLPSRTFIIIFRAEFFGLLYFFGEGRMPSRQSARCQRYFSEIASMNGSRLFCCLRSGCGPEPSGRRR